MSQDRPEDRDAAAEAESPTRTMGEEAATPAPDLEVGETGLEVGQVLGGRYQIRDFLGRGGMGEVWRAFDLKLRVEVALKALRSALASDATRLELLRQEVRAAREVTSPNVCRIYDLVELDGSELVSMEYVDGQTLLDVLRDKAPMDPPEAQEIASQFLAGLEAIHDAGLVHRDVKPENLMVTRTGRVVLMDFGLARSSAEGAGTVSGTPAYMSPEQARGEADARSDLFSAGVILAEMVSPEGIRDFESRQSVWSGIRQEPVMVPDSPWAPVVKKAVAKDPSKRFQTVRELTRALEEVAFRVLDETGLEPYPGLASFDERDADYFFGREAEVEAVWHKLLSAQLLGIIGASGSGKSSFIGAGLIPARPENWAIVRCTPGSAATDSLRRAVISEIEGDAEAVRALAAGGAAAIADAFGCWRNQHDEVLLVVDQFEELFTQNTDEEQARCAEVLGRITLDADVHVLLSMRDDFLMRCNPFGELQPVFSELTALDPPRGSALRRAVVQPAFKCGYRFEDEELVDEILAEVEGERGALPLLAFALARLWEQRDRENGLITRQAYKDIGGVAGALAQHAESLMERLGPERHPIVREFFRNLVTAQGTRAARDVDELLSVFRDDRDEASEVLGALIDARLLTSYEVPTDDGPGAQRVEVIHESLLSAWPRLVRWQAQDAEGALLRDQLRQAAAVWNERGRSDDLLWTGAAFREYQVWRERYPGGLTEVEEAFARSMTALATRRRRRRRFAGAAALVLATVVAAVFAVLWRRSELETRRAEAQKLIALGQVRMDEDPTATLAYATASLELADSEEARLLALEALWMGPPALVASREHTVDTKFSFDNRWLLQSIGRGQPTELRLIGADGVSQSLGSFEDVREVAIDADLESTRFVAGGQASQRVVMWTPPEVTPVADLRFDGRVLNGFGTGGGGLRVSWRDGRALLVVAEPGGVFVDELAPGGSLRRLGRLELNQRPPFEWINLTAVDSRSGRWLATVAGGEVVAFEIGEDSVSEPRRLGRHDGCTIIDLDPRGRFLATGDASGEIRLWDPVGDSTPRTVDGPPGLGALEISDEGALMVAVGAGDEGHFAERSLTASIWQFEDGEPVWLRDIALGEAGHIGWGLDPVGRHVVKVGPDSKARLWPLRWPADSEPLTLSGRGGLAWAPGFDHRGEWLVTSEGGGVAFWPVAWRHPAVIRRHDGEIKDLLFEAGGRWLASASMDGTVRVWPLEGEVPEPGRIVAQDELIFTDLECSPDGRWLLSGAAPRGSARLLSLEGLEARELAGFARGSSAVSLSFDGRLAAGSSGLDMSENMIRVWDLASGKELQRLGVEEVVRTDALEFTEDGQLLSGGPGGLTRWDVETGEAETVFEGLVASFATSEDARRVLLLDFAKPSGSSPRRVVFLDLETGESRELQSHGRFAAGGSLALDPAGTIAVTAEGNVVRVGSVTGEEPHLLLGHEGQVTAAAVDPLGRWIATAGVDETIRLWPMPDLSRPPLHTLPREELIAKLKTLTNVRVTRDAGSSTGWSVTYDPFPGWETVPTW